jgi:hypothetical protein
MPKKISWHFLCVIESKKYNLSFKRDFVNYSSGKFPLIRQGELRTTNGVARDNSILFLVLIVYTPIRFPFMVNPSEFYRFSLQSILKTIFPK